MADEFQLGNNNINWWDTSRTTRFDESSQTPSSSTTLNNNNNNNSTSSSFGWPTEMVDIKAVRMSSVDSLSVSGSSMFLSDPQSLPPSALQESPPSAAACGGGGGGALTDPNLQIMGLGLSSHGMDWNNQPVFRDEKAENSSFRSMLEDGMSSNTYFHHHQESLVPSTQDHWRQKLFSAPNDSDNEAAAAFPPVDASATAYGDQSMFEGGLLTSHNHQQQLQPSSYQPSYCSLDNSGELMMQPNNNVSNKFPKQQEHIVGQLHFSNSAPFWNATAAAMNDVRSSFFPSLQTQLTTSTFDEKQKNTSEEVRNLGATVNKSSSETSNKRPRNESSSPLPAFKVRKEKMGDRVTALQQLVSPFGKTDTASVLSEAIGYIKFLHEQVNVLSTPYMRAGAIVQNQQHPSDNKAKDPEAQKQDLRSRGLCLVPVSSTFPVTHETTVDFWTPTFGGTFR